MANFSLERAAALSNLFFRDRSFESNDKNNDARHDGFMDILHREFEYSNIINIPSSSLVEDLKLKDEWMMTSKQLEDKCWQKITNFKRRDDKDKTERQARTVLRRSKRIASRKKVLGKNKIDKEDDVIMKQPDEQVQKEPEKKSIAPEADTTEIVERLVQHKADKLRKALKKRNMKCPRRKVEMAKSLASVLVENQELDTCPLLKDEDSPVERKFEELMRWKNADLKSALKAKNLSTTGHKAELAGRLAHVLSISSDAVDVQGVKSPDAGATNKDQIPPEDFILETPNKPSSNEEENTPTAVSPKTPQEQSKGTAIVSEDNELVEEYSEQNVPSAVKKKKISVISLNDEETIAVFSPKVSVAPSAGLNKKVSEVVLADFTTEMQKQTNSTQHKVSEVVLEDFSKEEEPVLVEDNLKQDEPMEEEKSPNAMSNIDEESVDDVDESFMDILNEVHDHEGCKTPGKNASDEFGTPATSTLDQRLQKEFDSRLKRSAKSQKCADNTRTHKDSMTMQKCKRKTISPISISKSSPQTSLNDKTITEESMFSLDVELDRGEKDATIDPTPLPSMKKKPRILRNLIKAKTFLTEKPKPDQVKKEKVKKPLIPALEKARLLKLQAEQREKEKLKKKQLFDFKLKQKKLKRQNEENNKNYANSTHNQNQLQKSFLSVANERDSEYELTDGYVSDESDSSYYNSKPRKRIPRWASSKNIAMAVRKFKNVDPDTIFPPMAMPRLEDLFPNIESHRLQKLKARGSSAKWVHDKVSKLEIKRYKKDLNITSRLFKQ